jgi:transcriptional regulator with XRE-family HTH domain
MHASAITRIVVELKTRGGLKATDIANIASVSPSTVSNWTNGASRPDTATQLVISDLRYVVDRLAEFYTPDEIRLWLYAEHRLLNGDRPIDLIRRRDAAGLLEVIESLGEASYS